MYIKQYTNEYFDNHNDGFTSKNINQNQVADIENFNQIFNLIKINNHTESAFRNMNDYQQEQFLSKYFGFEKLFLLK
jgi:hypothetical protein